MLPAPLPALSQEGQSLLGSVTEGSFGGPWIAQLFVGYLNLAGIESGYSYFAPNVGDTYKLVFEFTSHDGHVDYDSFTPETSEGELRLASLLDQLVKTQSSTMREAVIKSLTQSAWQRYPEMVHVKAILGALKFPGPGEYRKGERASYEILYAYDFSLADEVNP